MAARRASAIDYYRFLGLAQDASQQDIEQAYRRLAKKFHPDVNPEDREWNAGLFKVLQEAYEVLSDPMFRREYDERLQASSAGQSSGGDEQVPPQPAIEPEILDFGTLADSDAPKVMTARLLNHGGSVFMIEIQPQFGEFWSVSGEGGTDPGELARFHFEVDPSAVSAGHYEEVVRVFTDGVYAELTLRAKVRADRRAAHSSSGVAGAPGPAPRGGTASSRDPSTYSSGTPGTASPSYSSSTYTRSSFLNYLSPGQWVGAVVVVIVVLALAIDLLVAADVSAPARRPTGVALPSTLRDLGVAHQDLGNRFTVVDRVRVTPGSFTVWLSTFNEGDEVGQATWCVATEFDFGEDPNCLGASAFEVLAQRGPMTESKVTYPYDDPGGYALKHGLSPRPTVYDVAVPLFTFGSRGVVTFPPDHSPSLPSAIPIDQTAQWSPRYSVHVSRVLTYRSGYYSILLEATGDEDLKPPDGACVRFEYSGPGSDYSEPGWDGVGLTTEQPGNYVGRITLPLIDGAHSYWLDYWCDERTRIDLF